jgi:CNT family concentrative nucleoside transporter
MDITSLLRGLLGVASILGIVFLVSNNRRLALERWRIVGMGLLIQVVLAVFILKGTEMGAVFAPLGWPLKFFEAFSSLFVTILSFVENGATFIFGNLALGPGKGGSLGFFFAFQVLPTLIVFSALMSLLYHLGIMQVVVRGMAWVMAKLLGTSGAESLSNTANIFVGQTEAPLVIKPFIQQMTRSELLTIMVGGMATIAGGVMASYIQILGDAFAQANQIPLEVARLQFAKQLLGASVMAAPAGLVLAKIMYPETEESQTKGTVRLKVEKAGANVIDAAAIGAADGIKLAANVGGMLIAFIALIAMVNALLGWGTGLFGLSLTLEQLLGWALAPVAWLIGVPWADATDFGALLGTKLILNEFVAYTQLVTSIQTGAMETKAVTMAAFALCGFANFSSIAIQIGGIGPLAPHRTSEIAQLGLRAVLGGTLANMMTATIAGAMLG